MKGKDSAPRAHNSIMGFYNFKNDQNNLVMGYYSFKMGLYIIHYGLMFAHDGLSNGKTISIMGTIFWKIELYYDDYGLIYVTLWTYVFPMMACPMGITIRL